MNECHGLRDVKGPVFPLACRSTLKCPSLSLWTLFLDCTDCFHACYSTFPGRDKTYNEDTGTKCEGPEGQMEDIKAYSRKGPSTREGRPEVLWRPVVQVLIHRRTEMLPGKERRNQGIGAQEGLVEKAETNPASSIVV